VLVVLFIVIMLIVVLVPTPMMLFFGLGRLSRTRESASADPRERFRESATLLARIRD